LRRAAGFPIIDVVDMNEYRICLLGDPRVLSGEKGIRISRRKSLALLAFVAVSDVKASRSQIAGLLWPEHDEAHARGALRTTLSTLNSELGETLVAGEGDYLHLRGSVRTDVIDFRKKALTLKKNEFYDAGVVRELEEAAAMYAGDFMAGFFIGREAVEFEAWQFMQVESLRKLFSRVLERLVQCHTLTADFRKATAFAERWTDHEPENEHAHRRLMELYAWMGKKREALHQYGRCAAILKRDLDVEPEESTQRLYRLIKDNRLKMPERGEENKPGIPALPCAGSTVSYSTVLSVGLTNAAEKLQERQPYDAASVVDILCHQAIEEILKKHHAHAWLVTGDTLAALFGVPNAGRDDAYRAVIAAIEILQASGDYGFKMAAGIATGLVYSKSDESRQRSFALLGPALIQAGLLRFFGDPGTISVEENTRERTKDAVAFDKLGGGFPGLSRTLSVYRLRSGDETLRRFV
jgi:DNA-binding SARP family transcriptional activator/class 3 adenylate cyclase